MNASAPTTVAAASTSRRDAVGRPAQVVVFDSPEKAITSLESVDLADCSHVAFDPGPRVSQRFYPIPDVIRTLEGLT